jgi:L-ascorbate metabolism protein UlaG (beta-lactamase superfamily)
VIFAPRTVENQLKGYNARIVKPGDTADLGAISFQAVPSHNLKSLAHPKGDENVGYVLAVNGVRIYHAGDTDFVPGLKELKSIDVALVPFDGGTTMGSEEAAALVNAIKPRIVIPMHYGLGSENLGKYLALLDPGIVVKILQKK